jgi:hypothetical protein
MGVRSTQNGNCTPLLYAGSMVKDWRPRAGLVA